MQTQLKTVAWLAHPRYNCQNAYKPASLNSCIHKEHKLKQAPILNLFLVSSKSNSVNKTSILYRQT